ncbi:transporter [Paenibacillus swuensis]|uniref:Transporter n=1 Tax=Paenibacillus swuensis TaxID=1178515 RepID=A0A172TNA6_9BACL|nr:multidrug efflux SMR transporter [Paenibacillus swuensis]ANE48528.1 transporter [Paenibacillus swuensis]
MAWMYLVCAGVFEMTGVAMMNKAQKDRHWTSYALLSGSFAVSFILLWFAMRTLPMGTAYAVWTGIGAAGGTLIGMIVYGETKSLKRILFLCMVLGSAIGLKLVS